MAPKRRRPAAAGPVARRPAAAPGVVRGRRESKKLCDLSLQELKVLGTIYLEDAHYYGRVVELCGTVVSIRMTEGNMMMDLKACGTTDDGLLRAVTGVDGRMVEVHICEDGCPLLLTGDRLVHGRKFQQVQKTDKEWFTNMEAVVPGPGAVDELRGLREAAGLEGAQPGGDAAAEDPKGKDAKDKKRKEKEDKKEVSGKKAKKKEGSASSQDEEEMRGKKELSAIFAGTGLDPDVKKRGKYLKKARRMGKKKKKKKKKDSESSSSTGSGSSSTPSAAGESSLFSTGKRVKRIWQRYPGALTAGSLKEAKDRLLTSSGSLWSEDRSSLPPLFVHYARTNLLGTGVSPPMAQEILTLCMTMDLVIQGRVAAGMDVLSQRLKALESLTKGSHWSVARQHELCRIEQSGIAEEDEALEASRLAREEEKLRVALTRGTPSGKGSEGAKGRKGKDTKSAGRGRGEEGGKGRGGDGKRDDQSWQKKK